jgi:hypothetical protein
MMTYEEVFSLWEYDPDTGSIFWKIKPYKSRVNVGDRADSSIRRYRVTHYKGVNYLAHRVAWLLYYGQWPVKSIDHIDKNAHNNKIENLRQCEHWQNCANRGKPSHNTSGFKGVCWVPRKQRWRASLNANGKSVFQRTFRTKEEAYEAYCREAVKYHGEFARHG